MNRSLPLTKFLVLLWAVAGFVLLNNAVAQTNAAPSGTTAAGTVIQNQASSSYVSPNGTSSVIQSNIVTITVAPVYGLNILPDAGNAANVATNFLLPPDPSNNRRAVPGSELNFGYQIENTGNTTERILLSTLEDTTDNLNFLNTKIFLDLNNNATHDSGEPELTSAWPLLPGERIGVVVVAQLPSLAVLGEIARLDLSGTIVEDPTVIDNNNIAKAIIIQDANLSLNKQALGPNNNRIISYTLAGSNVGNRAAQSKPGAVILDGVLTDGILIEDAIPANSILSLTPAATASANGVTGPVDVIYKIGTDWTRTPSPSATSIGLLIEDANPTTFDSGDALGTGGSYKLVFSVQLAASAIGGSEIRNTATISYQASDGEQVLPSNQTRSGVPFWRGVLVGPHNQATGIASGNDNYTDPATNITWNIARAGDAADQSDNQLIASTNGATTISFINTVINTGNIEDSFALGLDARNPLTQLAGAVVQIFESDGTTPLAGAFTLTPGTSKDFVVRLTLPLGAGSVTGATAVILARSINDQTVRDTTRDAIGLVAELKPWLGPIGLATATEYPNAADQQNQNAQVNSVVVFKHSLKNAGTLPDPLGLEVMSIPAGWTARWLNANNQVLTDTNNDGLPDAGTLAPGQTIEVRLELTPKKDEYGTNNAAGWNIVSQTRSGLQPNLINRTLDVVDAIEAPSITWKLTKRVSPITQQKPGDELQYEIDVENISGFEQTNAIVEDALSQWLITPHNIQTGNINSNLGPLASAGAWDAASHKIVWSLPTVPVGAKFTLSFTANISQDTPDASALQNIASAKSQTFPMVQTSNTVTTNVMGQVLSLEKKALNESVSIGGRMAFELVVTSSAKTITLENILLEDLLPLGLQYVPGTSKLGNQNLADPTTTAQGQQQKLQWILPTLAPGQTLRLRFETLGTALLQPGKIINTATASATALGTQLTVTSNTATATANVRQGIFETKLTIIGRVFLDNDDDNNFTDGDTTLAGARVYLSNGQFVITDQNGNYSFPSLAPGTYVLRLDPLTTPYESKIIPGSNGMRGTRMVHGQVGIEQADFPLFAPNPSSRTSRRTWLSQGPIQIEKIMERAGSGFLVTFKITVAEPVSNLQLFDAKPTDNLERENAELTFGNASNTKTISFDDNQLSLGDLKPGEYVLRYAMLYGPDSTSTAQEIQDLNDDIVFAQFTDPSISWEASP